MSDDIMKNIQNAAQGNPYNGSGVPASYVQSVGMNDVSAMNGNALNLDSPMKLIHSMNIETLNLYENG